MPESNAVDLGTTEACYTPAAFDAIGCEIVEACNGTTEDTNGTEEDGSVTIK